MTSKQARYFNLDFFDRTCSRELEARQCSEFLGEEFVGHLAIDVEGMGEGSTDGSTRSRVRQERERLWGKVLERKLGLHPNQGITGPRPVWSWWQRDKMCIAWLLGLPGASGLSSAQFGESSLLAITVLHRQDWREDWEDKSGSVWG